MSKDCEDLPLIIKLSIILIGVSIMTAGIMGLSLLAADIVEHVSNCK